MSEKPMDHNIWAVRFNKIFGKKFILVGRYTKNANPVTIRCRSCKNEKSPTANNIKIGIKCKCEYNKTGPKAETKKSTQIELNRRYGKNVYKLGSDYSIRSAKCSIKHECGIIRFIMPSDLVRKNAAKCSCLHIPKKGLEAHQKEVVKWRGNKYECLEYSDVGTSLYRHKVCGHEWETTWRSFRLSKTCPKCHGPHAQKITGLSIKEIKRRIVEAHDGSYKFIGISKEHDTLSKSGGKIIVQHLCGENYEVFFRQLTQKDLGRCPKCYGLSISSIKEVEVAGKLYKCTGYEPIMLKIILRKWPGIDVVTSGDPRMKQIRYTFNSKRSTYYPDFYIKSKNLIIEVKSVATLGLVRTSNAFFGEDVFERNQAKAKQCIKLGYKFIMALYKNGKRIYLPDKWMSMRKEQVAKYLNISI